MSKKFNNRRETTKKINYSLNLYKYNSNYSSRQLAEDVSKILGELIRDFEKLRLDLVSGNLELSPSQEKAYNRCHNIWNDNTLNPTEQLIESYKSFLEVLGEFPDDSIGYSIAEIAYLHRLSKYELLQTDKYLGLSDYGFLRGISALKKIHAVDKEEVEKLKLNALIRLISIKLSELSLTKEEIIDIVKRIKSPKYAREVLTAIDKGTYKVWDTRNDIEDEKRVKQ